MSEDQLRPDGRSGGDGRSARNEQSRAGSRFVLTTAAVVVALAIAGLGLMKLGAKVMATKAERTAISVEQYRSARVGAVTRPQLAQRFGPALRMPKSVAAARCDYYLQRDRHAVLFKLCFDATGTLTSKTRASN